MKKAIHRSLKVVLFATILLTFNLLQAHNVRDTIGAGSRILFSENKGQWDSRVLFRSQMRLSTLFVERDCFTLRVQHRENGNLSHFRDAKRLDGRYRDHSYRIRFEGSAARSVEGKGARGGLRKLFHRPRPQPLGFGSGDIQFG